MKNLNKIISPIIISMLILVSSAAAGPPFNTDDPVPVDLLHWEFYIASAYQFGKYDDNATLPHFEVNYGAFRDVQLHLVIGPGYAKADGDHQYGFMTAEAGFKYRFINDEANNFQVGIFPLIEIPTTSKESIVGNNHLQAFLPVWVQKSWGKFTTYGGAGYWINSGENGKNSVFAGWQAQYDITKTLSLGGEIYYKTPDTKDSESDVAFKVGGFINLDEENHILFSVGHSFKNTDVISGYLGYQVTI
jgi:hypothetical protein